MLLPFGPDAAYPNAAATRALRSVDGIVAVSEFLAGYVRQYAALEAVSLPLQGLEMIQLPRFRNWGAPWITMINPCALKGITIFIAMAEAFPEYTFAAVPTWGTTSHDRAELLKHKNITIVPAEEKIEMIFSSTKVLLVPSLCAEGRGRVVSEAMLCGVPVLASNQGGLPEAGFGALQALPVNGIREYSAKMDERGIRIPIIPFQDVEPWERSLRDLLATRDEYENACQVCFSVARENVGRAGLEKFEAFLSQL
jgi:glycosyltransferase involved in cell wall biosynthesis